MFIGEFHTEALMVAVLFTAGTWGNNFYILMAFFNGIHDAAATKPGHGTEMSLHSTIFFKVHMKNHQHSRQHWGPGYYRDTKLQYVTLLSLKSCQLCQDVRTTDFPTKILVFPPASGKRIAKEEREITKLVTHCIQNKFKLNNITSCNV